MEPLTLVLIRLTRHWPVAFTELTAISPRISPDSSTTRTCLSMKRSNAQDLPGHSTSLIYYSVAGARFELATFGL